VNESNQEGIFTQQVEWKWSGKIHKSSHQLEMKKAVCTVDFGEGGSRT